MFIDLHHKTSGRYDDIVAIDNEARSGKIKIVTSALSRVEVVRIKNLGLLPQEQEQQIEKFFQQPYISMIPMDRPVARKAAEIVRTHSPIKLADAIHIATAITKRMVEAMCTYDGSGSNPGLLALDKKVEGLRIVTPADYLKFGTIFAKT